MIEVPVVVYEKYGARRVIGTAQIETDGHIVSTSIEEPLWEELTKDVSYSLLARIEPFTPIEVVPVFQLAIPEDEDSNLNKGEEK